MLPTKHFAILYIAKIVSEKPPHAHGRGVYERRCKDDEIWFLTQFHRGFKRRAERPKESLKPGTGIECKVSQRVFPGVKVFLQIGQIMDNFRRIVISKYERLGGGEQKFLVDLRA